MTKFSKLAAIALVLIGILLAVMAWVANRNNKASVQLPTRASEATATVEVVTAQRDLRAGQPLAVEDLRMQQVEQFPEGGMRELHAVVGRTPAVDIAQSMPVQQGDLLSGLSGMLQPGERAVAIKVEEFSSVGYKLQPGDWVDVFAVLRRDGQEVNDTQARLLMARKKVLAFGAELHPAAIVRSDAKEEEERDARKSSAPTVRTAVIAVQVEEVSPLVLADQHGQVMLALRSPLDAAVPSAVPVWSAKVAAVRGKDSMVTALDSSLSATSLTALLTAVPHQSLRAAVPEVVRPAVGAASSGVGKAVPVPAKKALPKPSTTVEVVRGTQMEKVRY